ncbi:MAG TPA: DUF4956 domain-containing protein [Kofleriaceae bacterium]|jgi:hypothetical protein
MFDLEQILSISGGTPPTLKLAFFSLIGALLLGQLIAVAYVWSYRGMSYTRSQAHAITISGVIACMLMQAANNNLAAGIGIAGSLSVLRLRIALRDPKDLVFIFAGVAVGVACGVHAFTVAIAGTVVFIGTALGLVLLEMGGRDDFDGTLRFHGPTDEVTEAAISTLLNKYAKRFVLLTLRETRQGEAVEYAYHLRLRQEKDRVALVRELEAVKGVDGVTLYYQEATTEF